MTKRPKKRKRIRKKNKFQTVSDSNNKSEKEEPEKEIVRIKEEPEETTSETEENFNQNKNFQEVQTEEEFGESDEQVHNRDESQNLEKEEQLPPQQKESNANEKETEGLEVPPKNFNRNSNISNNQWEFKKEISLSDIVNIFLVFVTFLIAILNFIYVFITKQYVDEYISQNKPGVDVLIQSPFYRISDNKIPIKLVHKNVTDTLGIKEGFIFSYKDYKDNKNRENLFQIILLPIKDKKFSGERNLEIEIHICMHEQDGSFSNSRIHLEEVKFSGVENSNTLKINGIIENLNNDQGDQIYFHIYGKFYVNSDFWGGKEGPYKLKYQTNKK